MLWGISALPAARIGPQAGSRWSLCRFLAAAPFPLATANSSSLKPLLPRSRFSGRPDLRTEIPLPAFDSEPDDARHADCVPLAAARGSFDPEFPASGRRSEAVARVRFAFAFESVTDLDLKLFAKFVVCEALSIEISSKIL